MMSGASAIMRSRTAANSRWVRTAREDRLYYVSALAVETKMKSLHPTGSKSSNAVVHRHAHSAGDRSTPAAPASKLLQVAARSSHDINLHVRSSFSLGAALQQVKGTQSLGGNSSNAFLCSNCGHGTMHDVAWLSAVLLPWLSTPAPTAGLQHITTIWLQDMVLDHPMPECIGQACPGLICYGLQNVTWPDTAVTRCWLQVQQLTLQDICTPQLPLLFTPATLPQLSRLHLVWSEAYSVVQNAYQPVSDRALDECCRGFCNQLLMLDLEGLAWLPSMLSKFHTVYPQLQSLSISNQLGRDDMLPYIIDSTPNIRKLHFGVLSIEGPSEDIYTWEELKHFRVETLVGDPLSILASLPRMPKLSMVTLTTAIGPTDISVGPDWLGDVAKVIASCPCDCIDLPKREEIIATLLPPGTGCNTA